jgi:serine/threonine-protein kinase
MLAARVETACSNKFVILRSLAMGGMAEILLARVRDPVTPERLVVLKRLHRHLAVDREYVQMFVDEARLATTLRHANVVEVYEFGEDGDQYYIAMEYLHGHDLRHVLSRMAKQRIAIGLAHTLTIAQGMCRGLDYTHRHTDPNGDLLGIVHRDVSPHNVLLTYRGHVKLVDFGIAKASSQISRTRTGILKGKVAYMSPEQAMGDGLDRRSDVFCIGILLWEMTTGQWLYHRKSELETLKAVVDSDAPRPSQLRSDYPRELEQIVMKTLARERDQRWSTAGELGDALDEFAKRRRIKRDPAMLRALMSSVFREELAACQDAQRAGISLGDHLVAELDREANARGQSGPGGTWSRGGPGDHGGAAAQQPSDARPTSVASPRSGSRPSSRPAELDARLTLDGPPIRESLSAMDDLPTTVLSLHRTTPQPMAAPRMLRWPPTLLRGRLALQRLPSALRRWSPKRLSWPRSLRRWPPPRRTAWLTSAAIVAIIAAIWLLSVVLHHDAP